ncbi:M50 family metallopeptidase [Candidatus Latescibacterota bacterium]
MPKLRQKAAIFWEFRYYLLAAIIALVLWDTMLILPFRLFMVMVHEVCHAAAALATGGEVGSVQMAYDESGVTLTRGGIFPVIVSAGYVGSACLGALLIYTGSLPQLQRILLLLIGGTVMGMTMKYTPVGGIDFYLGIFGGLVLVSMALKSQRAGAAGSIWLGVMLCLYSLQDFWSDLLWHTEMTDAGILAGYIGIPILAYPIALLWVVISMWVMYRAMRSLVRNRQRRR